MKQPFRGPGSTLFAALLAALVFLSGLDLHPAGEVHDLFTALGGDGESRALASGPASLAQLSPARPDPAKRPLCPACLHRLQIGGAHLPAKPPLLLPSAAGRLAEAARPLRLQPPAHRLGARAPPLS